MYQHRPLKWMGKIPYSTVRIRALRLRELFESLSLTALNAGKLHHLSTRADSAVDRRVAIAIEDLGTILSELLARELRLVLVLVASAALQPVRSD